MRVFLAEAGEVYPDAVALRRGDESATYSELANQAARLADCLIDGGVRPGDRVAIVLPNEPAFVAALYGVWYAGGVAVPMSPPQSARAVEYVLTISGSRVLRFTSRPPAPPRQHRRTSGEPYRMRHADDKKGAAKN